MNYRLLCEKGRQIKISVNLHSRLGIELHDAGEGIVISFNPRSALAQTLGCPEGEEERLAASVLSINSRRIQSTNDFKEMKSTCKANVLLEIALRDSKCLNLCLLYTSDAADE